MGLEEYKSTQDFAEDRFELILKLYDKIILDLRYIEKYSTINKLNDENLEDFRNRETDIIHERNLKLHNAIDIVEVLKDSLDLDTPELKTSSEYLLGLYEYQLLSIYKLSTNFDKTLLSKLINVFSELKLGFIEQISDLRTKKIVSL